MMKKKVVLLALVACLAAGGTYLYVNGLIPGLGDTGKAKQARRGGERPVPVIVAAVKTENVPIQVETIGSVEAFATVSIKSRVDGQVMESFFKEGQMVHKGDRLFTIDPRTYQAKVHQLEANLARDKAQLSSAKADLSRYTKLSQTGFSSQQKLEQARAAAEALEAAMKADVAAIEGAKLDLAFTSIVSPIDGRTGSVLVDPGNLVKANDTNPIVVINQTEPVYVTFSVPEHYLPEIKSRMAAGGLPVEAVVPGANVTPEYGPVVFVNNAVDSATGTIQLKAEIANKSERLTPGQFVRAKVTLHEIANALVIPSQAVQNGQDGTYVYVVQPNRTVAVRNVTVGPSYGDDVVIEKGVAAGDTVVTEGQLRLRPGIRVTVPQDEGKTSIGETGGKNGGKNGEPAT